MKNSKLNLFIDLDGTVYDKNNGMWEEMSSRMDSYIRAVIGIPEEELLPTRDKYYSQYGSTLRGLQLHHAIDTEDYLAFVHDLDLKKYLSPDPDLRYHLKTIPYPKWIFTNSDRNHTLRVLKELGIEDLFEGILDVWAMSCIPKPDRYTYQNALALAGHPDPSSCIFVDDTLKNLAPAQAMGWHTVWVDGSTTPPPSALFSIPKLHYLPNVIEQIESQAWLSRTPIRQYRIGSLQLATLD